MIKAIFFDFDGVLTLHGYGGFTIVKNLVAQTGVTEEKIKSCWEHFKKDLKIGNVEYKDMWQEFCTCLGKKIDISVLEFVNKNVPLNIKMIELVRKLHEAGYKTGIISSNIKERMDAIREEFGLDNIFDTYSISSDLHSDKKDTMIFEKALQDLSVEVEESVFIDNHAVNLVVPEKMGFKTYFFDHEKNDVEAFVKQLEIWGVKV